MTDADLVGRPSFVDIVELFVAWDETARARPQMDELEEWKSKWAEIVDQWKQVSPFPADVGTLV